MWPCRVESSHYLEALIMEKKLWENLVLMAAEINSFVWVTKIFATHTPQYAVANMSFDSGMHQE